MKNELRLLTATAGGRKLNEPNAVSGYKRGVLKLLTMNRDADMDARVAKSHTPDTLSRPTIQDVAQAAGVSTGTVSRVLNNREGVRPQTRSQVLETVKRLDYRPDTAARALSRGQAVRVGLHVAAGRRRFTPFFMLLLEHLMDELQSDGYRLEEIPSRPDGLPERLTDGVILLGAHDDDPRVAHLQAAGVPFVLLGHQEGVRWVAPDDVDGGLQATRHLLRLGHESIVHVSGPMHNQVARDRYRGYLTAFEEAFGTAFGGGLEPLPPLESDFTSLGAYRAVRGAWEGGGRFSAVFAATDEVAVGVVAALEDLGLRVPTDVSVVGFDDLPEVGAGLKGGLTTVRQEVGRVAASAVALLKEGLAGHAIRHETVPVQLVVRGTSSRRW